MTAVTVEVGGRTLQVSSLDRVLWPATGTTKAELLEHYLAAAPLLLSHVVGRPLTLHRFPQGVTGKHFFQTRTPPPRHGCARSRSPTRGPARRSRRRFSTTSPAWSGRST